VLPKVIAEACGRLQAEFSIAGPVMKILIISHVLIFSLNLEMAHLIIPSYNAKFALMTA
jgi:hypothetical protein